MFSSLIAAAAETDRGSVAVPVKPAVPGAQPARRRSARIPGHLWALLESAFRAARSVPFTSSVLVVMLAMGALTRTLWHALDAEDPALQAISYGAPQLGQHWWTFGAGAMVLPRPEFYLLIGLLLAVGLSWYERRVGSWRAAAVFIGA